MKKEIDARSLPCPQPVVQTKRALAEGGFSQLDILVDNEAAQQNVCRFAEHAGYTVLSTGGSGKNLRISIAKDKGATRPGSEEPLIRQRLSENEERSSAGAKTVFIKSELLGQGDPELGKILISAFLYALGESDEKPRRIILMNSGVKLAISSAKTTQDLQRLSEAGVEIIACGTCLDFYGLTEELAVGKISNMYDIAEALLEGESLSI